MHAGNRYANDNGKLHRGGMSEGYDKVKRLIHGDALEELLLLPDNSVDAIVSDPPCGIAFMGKSWDSNKGGRDAWVAWLAAIMREALRVTKPGGHALIWALPRTSHWTATALEDAGWEIRDEISHHYATDTRIASFVASLNPEQRSAWEMLLESQERPSVIQQIFGSGFPKSHNISVAIDKHFKTEREVIGQKIRLGDKKPYAHNPTPGNEWNERYGLKTWRDPETAPATPEAQRYSGFGSSLKPSHETWWLCRKPLAEPTIAENVLRYGTGGLNIDASRIAYSSDKDKEQALSGDAFKRKDIGDTKAWARPWMQNEERIAEVNREAKERAQQGRFPSNSVFSHTLHCQHVGTRKIHVDDKAHDRHNSAGTIFGQAGACVTTGYADADSLEEIDAWECVPECPVFQLSLQSGHRKSGAKTRMSTIGFGRTDNHLIDREDTREPSEGTAARYFMQLAPDLNDIPPFLYQSKPSRKERNIGCEALPERKKTGVYDERPSGNFHERLDRNKQEYKLRDDLTLEQREYVLSELAKIGGAI